MMANQSKQLGVIFCVVGAVVILIGVYSLLSKLSFLEDSTVASGTVIEIKEEKSGDRGGSSYYPIVRFSTQQGQAVVFTGGSQVFWVGDFEEGEAVTVRYDPTEPSEAKIDSFSQLWGATIFLFVLGGGFAAAGVRALLNGISEA